MPWTKPIAKHTTPFRVRVTRTRLGKRREPSQLAARPALVYSRASDDNVHAALNLSLLGPYPQSHRSLSFLPLHYIIFHPFRSSSLRRTVLRLFHLRLFIPLYPFLPPPPPPPTLRLPPLPPLPFFVPSSLSLLLLLSRPFSYFMRAGYALSPSARRTLPRITRNARGRRGERMFMH